MPRPRPRPRTRTRLARIAAVLVIGSAAAALGGACTSDFETVAHVTDEGGNEGSVDPAACPPAEPPLGSSCLAPEGTTCDFGQCGTRIARCTLGAWRFGANPAPMPPCPADPPTPASPCPPCWPTGISCTFGSTNCSAGDASVNTAIASCRSGKWVLDIRVCRDGGGPDVQRDGEADAD